MTIQVNIAKAKATLSELVARAEAGEEVVLARNGEAVARITPVKAVEKAGRRPLGLWDSLGLDLPLEKFTTPDLEVEAVLDDPIWPKD